MTWHNYRGIQFKTAEYSTAGGRYFYSYFYLDEYSDEPKTLGDVETLEEAIEQAQRYIDKLLNYQELISLKINRINQ